MSYSVNRFDSTLQDSDSVADYHFIRLRLDSDALTVTLGNKYLPSARHKEDTNISDWNLEFLIGVMPLEFHRIFYVLQITN